MYTNFEPIARSIRSLSIDAIEKAHSGHPGMPLGAAELAALLYGKILKHNPKKPYWHDRDRFVLSAGHASMLLYSTLHLAGYDVSLEDIKMFRQAGSRCPGHPEYGVTPGVEATTGPLGQGISTAVGMAIAETMLASRFNTITHQIINHHTYALVGEGCLMEGVCSEACSLAGTLKLGKLIVYFDKNNITIDGSTSIAYTEDTAKRFDAYGWHVQHGSMYSYTDIERLTKAAKQDSRPSLIILDSVIGKGAAAVEGTAAAHGAPLGAKSLSQTKKQLGLNPDKYFFADPAAYTYFDRKQAEYTEATDKWNKLFEAWSTANPEKRREWDAAFKQGAFVIDQLTRAEMPSFKKGELLATRTASKAALNAYAAVIPSLMGGSADLQGPNAVALQNTRAFTAESPDGRYIHFGVREFAMAAITNGIQLHGGLRAFCATFAVFSDYLRPALRLAALMHIPSIFVFTHDSVFIGEDGPTHQPVETLASLRAIPNTLVLRPCDAEETCAAWRIALTQTDCPVCLFLSRQGLPVLEKYDTAWNTTIEQGAYILKDTDGQPTVTIAATGSEVSLACEAAEKALPAKVRVVSVISKELFERQPQEIRNTILGTPHSRVIIAEAGIKQGWEGWVKNAKDIFSIERFGESCPAKQIGERLGYTVDNLIQLIQG